MTEERSKWKVRGGVLGVLVGGGVVLSVLFFFPSASHQGYAPEQPLPFSHQLHAGDYKIPCLYCHSTAERSRHASVPGVGVCMNCHRVVKTESPWIQKLTQAYEKNEPLAWVRVHELPDYVYFSHQRHLARGLACQDCHGPVQTMQVMRQESPLTMGWCMECHRGQTTPEAILKTMHPGSTSVPPRGPVAPVECSTCHH